MPRPVCADPAISEGQPISFAGDLAPILARECTGCHGRGQRRKGLSLANFDSLAQGGESGPPVNCSDPEKSLLILKLRGTGPGQRMPLNRPPRSAEAINKFATWIRAGAIFDGKDPGQDVATLAAISRAQHASHEELSRQRGAIALRNWRLAMPDQRPNQAEKRQAFSAAWTTVYGATPEQSVGLWLAQRR